MKSERRFQEVSVVVCDRREQPHFVGFAIRVSADSSSQGLHVLRIEEESILVAEASSDVLATLGPECGSVLTNLSRQIDQRKDDTDPSDEITDISERFENVRLLPHSDSGNSLRSSLKGLSREDASRHQVAQADFSRVSVNLGRGALPHLSQLSVWFIACYAA